MKIAVLAEQNLNLIDGSTIWLLNACKLLALQSDFEIDLLLAHRLEVRTLANELPDTIRVHDAVALQASDGLDGPLTPDTLPRLLAAWEEEHGRYDRIFVRGTGFLTRLLDEPLFCDRIVAYAPSVIPDVTLPEPQWVQLGRQLRTPVVVQSEIAKRALEALSDYPAYVVHVVPPIVFPTPSQPRIETDSVTLCYSGKIELQYGLDWLIALCDEISDAPDLAVSMIAGKDTHRAANPAFFADMDRFREGVAQGAYPRVSLARNLAHSETKVRMGQGDFAFCLRHDRYDDVIEISTKIVEFCSLGVPPILNNNMLNRSLFGASYPYLVDVSAGDIPARLQEIMRSRHSPAYQAAKERCTRIAAQFSAEALSVRLGRALRGHDKTSPALAATPRHILIATHERKFLHQITDRLRGEPEVTVSWEAWESTIKPRVQPYVPDEVDTVFCEWCCENAVWHSRNKRPDTRLIVRLHRFEAFRDFPERVDWAQVDALIVVSDHFRDLMISRFGVDPSKIHVLPQFINWHELQRDKLPEAQFTLGLVGINPFEHKRFDRAIDFFAALRARDDRFRLAVRSVMPWEIDWVWDRQDETRALFEAQFARIFSDPDLSATIRFDSGGPDMEEWYRGIGTILSSSDTEGCHTSVLEGMAAGCLPVVYDWPGAQSLFAPHVYSDMAEAIPEVISFAECEDIASARTAFSTKVQKHDVEKFIQYFMGL